MTKTIAKDTGTPPHGATFETQVGEGGELHQIASGDGDVLTTQQGIPVFDDQNSLKVGDRGPTLLEDFHFREKIFHFDHERIPERVVHARGYGAHGTFTLTESLEEFTSAGILTEVGEQTPMFVRFSTVAGNKGSADLARDVRGFSAKFYTKEGNWDIVGNNIPVFFIQDAIKFPDLIHAAKQEPDRGFPQAQTAHDNFWDFISLTPESMHMVMWIMSDRTIPRGFRFVEGFGVHTFRLINAEGKGTYVKFHFKPKLGLQSVAWNEAVKINGADPDFHRRDLWEAIEAGEFPEYELAIQVFTEEQAEGFPFDVLDATKIVPEELVPLQPIGKMVLNRNPDNFFAETEQVAFCTAHIVPGIDFTNDPLLQGRIHSYVDTQISRLGGPNFHEIPINAPVNQVHNNQRDGMHRQTINRGRVSYEPNSLAGGCPFQGGRMAGFTSFPQPITEDKVRGKPALFADHYSQARLFWQSQTPVEKNHIIGGFRFELTRVTVPAIRERVLSMLVNVDATLAAEVADGLGMDVPPPQPLATTRPLPEYPPSPALSLFARPGKTGIHTRRVAILVANGSDVEAARTIYASLLADGAVPRIVSSKLGKIAGCNGGTLDVEITLEAGPSVIYDAMIVPPGDQAAQALSKDAHALEFTRLQYRHCKPIMVVDAGAQLLAKADIPSNLPDGTPDPGIIGAEPNDLTPALAAFKDVLAAHRVFQRETDPPMV